MKFDCIGISRHRIGRDGVGVTTLVGGHGCPLDCEYCLNPTCKKGSAPLTFTMEELYPPGTNEPPDPPMPFDITITRSGGEETYEGCSWTSVKREDTIRGVSQIRVGTAIKRTVLGIL